MLSVGSLTLRQHLRMIDQRKEDTKINATSTKTTFRKTATTSEASTTSSTNSHDDSSTSSSFFPCPFLSQHDYRTWSLPNDVHILHHHRGWALQATQSIHMDLGWEDDSLADSSPSYCNIQAPSPLPKPKEYTRLLHFPPPPVDTSCWGFGFNKKRRAKLLQQEGNVTASSFTWKPFQTSFRLSDGSFCQSTTLVSYFEVHVLAPEKQLCDTLVEPDVLADMQDISSHDESCLHVFEDALSMDVTYMELEKSQWLCDQRQLSIAIGISTNEFNPGQESMPGWDQHSVAYHGDDGAVFGMHTQQVNYGPTFGNGDTIGCGIDYRQAKVFFVKNGTFLGCAQLDMGTQGLSKKWKPTVGFDATIQTSSIQINLHGPFNFDLKAFMEEKCERCYL